MIARSDRYEVWTLFHGDQPWKRECPMAGHGEGGIRLSLSGLLRPRSTVGGVWGDGGATILVRHPKILDYCHLLALDCLIPPGGANAKIQRLDFMFGDGVARKILPIVVRAATSNVAKVVPGDFDSSAFSTLRNEISSSVLEQTLFFQILAIPKGDVRLCALTFRDRSLEPCYRMIRSIPSGIIIETASSY